MSDSYKSPLPALAGVRPAKAPPELLLIGLTGKKAGVRHPYRRAAAIVYYARMNRNWLGIAAINGALAVMAGAFAAHGLKARLSADSLAVFETGARYHMYHALAMAVAALMTARPAAIAFMGGIALFSGSLYLLALIGTPILGAITPIGGLCFIAGWALLAWRAFKGPI